MIDNREILKQKLARSLRRLAVVRAWAAAKSNPLEQQVARRLVRLQEIAVQMRSRALEYALEEDTVHLEPAGNDWQFLLPGFRPVSMRERIHHRSALPLRPRVAQRGLAGTALFG